MRNNRANQGFTLLEILVVLVLMIPVMLGLVKLMSTQSQSASTSTLIATQAQEMAALQNAATQYIGTVSGGWAAGAVNTLGIPAMVTANKLPAGFANRNGAVGTSPLFQAYVVQAMIAAADNKPRIVITLSGDPAPARLTRYGMTQSAADLQSYNQQVAEKVQALNAFAYSGVIAAGAKSVTGNYGAFTEDVSALLATAPNFPTAATLYGFPDLGPSGAGGGGASKYQHCQTYAPTQLGGVWSNPTCPAGWTQLTSFPNCGSWNTSYTPQYAVYGSDVGNITLQFESDNSSGSTKSYTPCIGGASMPDGGTCPGLPGKSSCYATQTMVDTSKSTGYVMLNGASVNSDGVCFARNIIPVAFPSGCCASQGGCTTVTAWRPPQISALSPATDILCCQ